MDGVALGVGPVHGLGRRGGGGGRRGGERGGEKRMQITWRYSGTPLILKWTPCVPNEVSCIGGEGLISEENLFGTQQSFLNTEVSLYQECPLRGLDPL